VATIQDAVKETIRAHLTLVHVFHTYALEDTPWVAHVLFHCTPVRYGRIASVSAAHDATQFGDSICHVCISTIQMLSLNSNNGTEFIFLSNLFLLLQFSEGLNYLNLI
jgi:hypothetical protein